MRTKEDIINERLLTGKDVIFYAMDEHAKEVAIEFDGWVHENDYIYLKPSKTYMGSDYQPLTTEELYNLFLKSKSI